MTQHFSSTDMALAQRLEGGHAHSGATANAERAVVEQIAGGSAIYYGAGLPMTQAIGIGMNGPVSPPEMDRLEAFFHDRGSQAVIDLCTLADAGVMEQVMQRGYVVREVSNVLVRGLAGLEAVPVSKGIEVEGVKAGDAKAWARLVVQGFTGQEEVPEDQVEMASSEHSSFEAFFGLLDSVRVGAAAMGLHEGLATLFGDSTLVRARGRGLQLGLIRHRLIRASESGCDLASASVVPGSISHRNFERAGFQLVYLRIMVSRDKP